LHLGRLRALLASVQPRLGVKGLALLGALLVSACAQPKSAQDAGRVRAIVGPDGSQMLHVSCGDDEGLCYQIAGQNCPSGYDVGRTYSQERGQFFVRCRPPNPYGSEWSQRGPNAGPPGTVAPPSTLTPPPQSAPAAPAGGTAQPSLGSPAASDQHGADKLFDRRD